MTDKGDMIRMPKYSVKKPMTVFVVIVIIIALGVVSLLGMTPDLMPMHRSAVCSRDDYVSGSYAPGGGDCMQHDCIES